MSLLGRLEDLSLTDIVQIVFLSRRTGVLEIIDAEDDDPPDTWERMEREINEDRAREGRGPAFPEREKWRD